MKNLNLIIWLTQLGISVAAPLAGFPLLALWLHRSLEWGKWCIWVGIILGIAGAVSGLRDSLRTMHKVFPRHQDADAPPPLSFNDHD